MMRPPTLDYVVDRSGDAIDDWRAAVAVTCLGIALVILAVCL